MLMFGLFDGRLEIRLSRPRSASPRVGAVPIDALATQPPQWDAHQKRPSLPFERQGFQVKGTFVHLLLERQEVQVKGTFVHCDPRQVSDTQGAVTTNTLPGGAPSAPQRTLLGKRRPRRGKQRRQKALIFRQMAQSGESRSRAVQALLETPMRQQVIDDFKKEDVWKTVCDQHMHHVLLSMIAGSQEEGADLEKTVEFVAQGLAGHGCEAAGHEYGCRVLVAMAAKRLRSEPFTSLYAEVLADIEASWKNRYTTFVLQTLLQHGTAEEQRRIVDWLSYTLETAEGAQVIAQPKDEAERESIFTLVVALTKCRALARPLAQTLVGNSEVVRELAGRRKYGAILLRALLLSGSHGPDIGAALSGIEPETLSILKDKIGRPCKDCARQSRSCQMAADAGPLLEAALAFA